MGWGSRTAEGSLQQGHRVPLLERPGVIAVLSGDRTTFPEFAADVATVVPTAGSCLIWQKASAGQVAGARNILAQEALKRDMGWIWFIDDDHVFSPDILGRLLRHDRDLVVPTVMTRKRPHFWIAWERFDIPRTATDEELVNLALANLKRQPTLAPGQRGLVEIGHGGAAGCLISREVLEAMPRPWFEFGRLDRDAAAEDTWFFLKSRRLGFQAYCDLDTRMGHLNTFGIWPDYDPVTATFKYFYSADSTGVQLVGPNRAREDVVKV